MSDSLYASKLRKFGYVIIPLLNIRDCSVEVKNDMSRKNHFEVLAYGKFQDMSIFYNNRTKLPQGWRITNAEHKSECIRHEITKGKAVKVLKEYYGGEIPTLLQSLYYEYGSGQQKHSDHATVDPPWAHGYNGSSLVGSTIYYDDVTPDNAPLFIYKSSHRVDGLSNLKYSNFEGNRAQKEESMLRFIDSHVSEKDYKEIVVPKFSLILWSANLIHGGKKMSSLLSRNSIIAHYANIRENEIVGIEGFRKTKKCSSLSCMFS